MSKTITLPSGGTATLRQPDELLSGEKRKVMKAVLASADNGEGALRFVARETLIGVLVEAWELPYWPDAPLPKDDPSALDRLQIADYSMLFDATESTFDLFFLRNVTPDDAGTPGSPTGPVGDS